MKILAGLLFVLVTLFLSSPAQAQKPEEHPRDVLGVHIPSHGPDPVRKTHHPV
jgi:hypothetical protein